MPTIAENAIAKFGKIDILINNAGLSQRSLAMETSIEVDKRLMDIDFIGTVALTKAVVPYMIKNKGGQIVVVSVLWDYLVHLCVVDMLRQNMLCMVFEALRAELYNDKVLVTIVCPGFVKPIFPSMLLLVTEQLKIQWTMLQPMEYLSTFLPKRC